MVSVRTAPGVALTSCSCTRLESFSQSAATATVSDSPTACPGIGIAMRWAFAATDGKMRFKASAAACALGVSPLMQSSKLNSVWRTGLEYETTPASTNVMLRTPQPSRHRATAQPSVPAPINKQRVPATFSVCSAGISRQRISRRLRSTEACHEVRAHRMSRLVQRCCGTHVAFKGKHVHTSARAWGFICAERSMKRGPILPAPFLSHPTALGAPPPGSHAGTVTLITIDRALLVMSPAADVVVVADVVTVAEAPGGGSRKQMTRTLAVGAELTLRSTTPARTRRFRNGHPGFVSSGHGSQKPKKASPSPRSSAARHSANSASGTTDRGAPPCGSQTTKKA